MRRMDGGLGPLAAVVFGILFIVPPTALADGNAENGAKVFKKCLACHRVGPDAKTLVGPELNGVVGRKAGSIEDYSYSPALKNSGLTWDEATLTEYLKSPRALVPGVRMTFPGLQKDDDIADVIAYLKQIDADGTMTAAPAPSQ
jgi:cytochrome c